MNYSQYLFSQLLSLYDINFAELPYDIQFGEAMEIYNQFEKSNFNVDILSEYDCIINYLSNTYKK
jgi:hypothetical protein